MEEILSVVHDHKKVPFSMTLEGNLNGKNEKFEHFINPSDLLTDYDSSYKKISDGLVSQTNEQKNAEVSSVMQNFGGLLPVIRPTVIAKWTVKHNGKSISDYITVPSTVTSSVNPLMTAKYIDVLSHVTVNENVQMYSSLKREKLLGDVTEEIKKVFPEIAGFDMIPYPDGSQAPISVVKNDGTILPLYACGDGVQRWFYMLGAVSLYKNSIICIDEIDTGFHPEAQLKFCKKLVQYANENNVQLFITTHNIEFIDRFLDATLELGEEYMRSSRIITLKNSEGEVKARTMNATEAARSRAEYRMELR
jgi:AAA15 family ATPase/GTPase